MLKTQKQRGMKKTLKLTKGSEAYYGLMTIIIGFISIFIILLLITRYDIQLIAELFSYYSKPGLLITTLGTSFVFYTLGYEGRKFYIKGRRKYRKMFSSNAELLNEKYKKLFIHKHATLVVIVLALVIPYCVINCYKEGGGFDQSDYLFFGSLVLLLIVGLAVCWLSKEGTKLSKALNEQRRLQHRVHRGY